MMRISIKSLYLLAGVIAFPPACVAQPAINSTFGYAQTHQGRWISVSLSDLQNYSTSSRVVCSLNKSEINFVWNSESGDWAAFDKYSSDTPFFVRTVRFAQFDETIQVTMNKPRSKPFLKIEGENVQQYEFLLSELAIWTQARSFPYKLPECALKIFNSR